MFLFRFSGGSVRSVIALIACSVLWSGCQPIAQPASNKPTNGGAGQVADTPTPPAPANDNADWPQYRGDDHASGVAKCDLPPDPQLQWEQKVRSTGFGSTAIVVRRDDGVRMAVVADMNGTLRAHDVADGRELWTFATPLGFNASPAWHRNRVYIGDLEGVFYCVDAYGKEVWKVAGSAQIDSAASVFEGRVLYTSQDSFLYCLDAGTGEKVWELETGDQLRCTPTVVNGQVFLAGCDGLLHVVDVRTGSGIGTVQIDSPTGATPAADGERVYFGTEQGGFFAVNLATREIAWRFDDQGDATAIGGNAAVQGERLYFGTKNRRVYCLNAVTGELVWEKLLKAGVETSPVLAGGRLYVASNDGRLYGMELETGEVFWEYEAGGGGFAASPAIAFDRLIIGTKRGLLLCLGSPLSPETAQRP